ILSPSRGKTGLTQFIGRVLRQPYARLTEFVRNGASLDECYVFCVEQSVGKAVEQINTGLVSEGMGDLESAVRTIELGKTATKVPRIVIARADAFKDRRILLPRVLHADEGPPSGWRDLDYEADILSAIDWDAIGWSDAQTYALTDDRVRRLGATIDLDEHGLPVNLPSVAPLDWDEPIRLDPIDLVRRLTNI